MRRAALTAAVIAGVAGRVAAQIVSASLCVGGCFYERTKGLPAPPPRSGPGHGPNGMRRAAAGRPILIRPSAEPMIAVVCTQLATGLVDQQPAASLF